MVRLATASGADTPPCLVKLNPYEARALAEKLVKAAAEADPPIRRLSEGRPDDSYI